MDDNDQPEKAETVESAMDDDNQPGNAEIVSATQVVDFANTDDVPQPHILPGSLLSVDPHEQVARLPPVDTEVTPTAPEIKEEGEHSLGHSVQSDPPASSNEPEVDDKVVSSDKPNEPVDTHKPVPTGPQAASGQPGSSEAQETSDAPGVAGTGLISDKPAPPDDILSEDKGKGIEQVDVLRVVPVIRGEDVGAAPSPVDATLLPKKGDLALSGPKKKRPTRRAGVGFFDVWGLGDSSRRSAVRTHDPKNDPKPRTQRKETQKDDQTKDDLKGPEVGEKTMGKPERTGTAQTTGKSPPSDPWEICDLDIRISDVSNGLTVDIVAVHDLDESKESAWTFVHEPPTQKNLKSLKDGDTESKRSTGRPSLEERIIQGLQGNRILPDGSKRRRGSTKDDATLSFVGGKVTTVGRIRRASEYLEGHAQHVPPKEDPSSADLASTEADTTKVPPSETDPAKMEQRKAQHPEAERAKTESAETGVSESDHKKTDLSETRQLGAETPNNNSTTTGKPNSDDAKPDQMAAYQPDTELSTSEITNTGLPDTEHTTPDALETEQPRTELSTSDTTKTGEPDADHTKADALGTEQPHTELSTSDITKNGLWESDRANIDPFKTMQPGTEPAKADITKAAPAKSDSAAPRKLSSHLESTSGPPQSKEPGKIDTSIAGPSTSRTGTKAISTEEAKKGNARPEMKRAKSSSTNATKKKSKVPPSSVSKFNDHAPPVSEAAEKIPPKPEHTETVVPEGRASKDIEESKASEKDQRSGRPSTEVDGRRTVHLFQEPTMIPGALPGARILSYTYPKLAPATAHEYVSKAAQKLLDRLISARSNEPYNAAPIIFIGYGFGGIVLQKLLILAASASGEKRAASAQILSLITGFVFLNTPFPTGKPGDATDKPSFPSESNARQTNIMRRLGEDGNKLNVKALWEKFDAKRMVEGQKLPIVWFHTLATKDASSASKTPPKRPLPELAEQAIFCMGMASESTKRAFSRFSGPKDPLYQILVAQLRRCLLFKASQRKELVHVLDALLELKDLNVDVQDEQGRSALHCAASSSNHAAVTMLVRGGEADVQHRDSKGQTPLHVAIQKAAELNPVKPEAQKPFRDMIERLMERAIDIFLTDQKTKTPWYYAKGLEWIETLKDNRDMHLGPTTSIGAHSLEPLSTPDPDTAQAKACENIRADLVEFYTITTDQKTQERQNAERSYVIDMIYNLGPQLILKLARPKLKDKEIRQCRWLHLPANNEQWVHDLFISLKIKDGSLIGQTDGSGQNLHMIHQANRYTQVCQKRYWQSNDRKTSVDPESPGTAGKAIDLEPETIERDAIVIFMPILAYEPSILRKKMSKNVRRLLRKKEIEEEENNRDIMLLKGYVGAIKPLHCRRTLDQFSYYMLESTESRDMDQVLLRWGRKRLEKAGNVDDAPVLMVDQLWLWVLHDGTVITSFPNAWEREEKQTEGLNQKLVEKIKPHGLKRRLDEEIKFNKTRPAIESADHLVHLIMKLSVDFLRRDAPGGIKFQDAFQSSINNIAEREAKQFKYFKTLTKKLSMKTPTEAQRIVLNGKLESEKLSAAQRLALTKKLNTRELTEAQRTENIEKLFELNLETHLLVEIKDIQDEINIVSSILGQQEEVLVRLLTLFSTSESGEVDSSSSSQSKKGQNESPSDTLEHSGDKPKHKSILSHPEAESDEAAAHEKKKGLSVHFAVSKDDAKSTEKDTPILKNQSLVEDNLAIVRSNIRIVKDMKNYAGTVHTSISNLLDLKQRQANAWEARFSREGSQQSQRQGNIMLVFTLVTIVFLPLSFMSSFFALGVNIFPKDSQSGNVSWPLHTLALLLFGISTLVFVPLVLIALYVNQITSFTRETFQAFFLPSNKIIDEPEVKKVEEEEESDDETFKGDDDESTKVAEEEEEHTEVVSEDTDETFARMFGIWTFHAKIPIVRELWRWKEYLNTADDDSEYLDDEGIDMDYPVQHFLHKVTEKLPTGVYRWLYRHRDEDSEYSSYYESSDDDDDSNSRRSRRSRRGVVEEIRRRDHVKHWRWLGRRNRHREEVIVIEERYDRPRFGGRRMVSPEGIWRRRSSDEVIVVEDASDDLPPRVRRGPRAPVVERRTRRPGMRRADSDDEDESVEEDSDVTRSRTNRLFGAVDLIARMFGRRIVDDDSESESEVDEDVSDAPPRRIRRPRILRAESPVERVTRRPPRRRADSDDDDESVEEESDVPQSRAGRLFRALFGRRIVDDEDESEVGEDNSDGSRPPIPPARRPRGHIPRVPSPPRVRADSDDEIVVIEEESDSSRTRARRARRAARAARAVGRTAGRSGRRRSDSDEEVVVIEEDGSDVPQSRVGRAFRSVAWMFRGRGRETEEDVEYSDETGSSDQDQDEANEEESEEPPRTLASRVLAPVGWMFRRRGRDQEDDEEYSDETRPSREEASATSGSDGPASVHRGLGAALREPLRRVFLRRRRVHDEESLVED